MKVALLPAKPLPLAKTRLGTVLADAERMRVAEAMFSDVLRALTAARGLDAVVVVTADDHLATSARRVGAVLVDEGAPRGLNGAVGLGTEAAIRLGATSVLVVCRTCRSSSPRRRRARDARPEARRPRVAVQGGHRNERHAAMSPHGLPAVFRWSEPRTPRRRGRAVAAALRDRKECSHRVRPRHSRGSARVRGAGERDGDLSRGAATHGEDVPHQRLSDSSEGEGADGCGGAAGSTECQDRPGVELFASHVRERHDAVGTPGAGGARQPSDLAVTRIQSRSGLRHGVPGSRDRRLRFTWPRAVTRSMTS